MNVRAKLLGAVAGLMLVAGLSEPFAAARAQYPLAYGYRPVRHHVHRHHAGCGHRGYGYGYGHGYNVAPRVYRPRVIAPGVNPYGYGGGVVVNPYLGINRVAPW